MRIFQKATVYAYKEIDDNLSKEEIEKQIDEFQVDLNLDLDNLGYGGNSDYKFIHDTDSMSEKEFRQEEGYAYKELLEDEVNLYKGSIKLFDILNTSKPKTSFSIEEQFADARYAYKMSLLNSGKLIGNDLSKLVKEDEIKLLEVLDKTCYIDALAIIDLRKKDYSLEQAKSLVKEISPVVAMREAQNHPKGYMEYYNNVEDAMVKMAKVIDKLVTKDISKKNSR